MTTATKQEAYEMLELLHISYQEVAHPAITSVKNLSFSLPGPQVKNLLLKSKKGKQIYFVILPDEKQADLKLLAQQLNEKRLSFVSEEEVTRLLHVLPGTVNPFALINDQENEIQVVIDTSIDRHDTVGFHPNVNTSTIIFPFSDFEKLLTYVEHLPRFETL
ncbi:YbaK/prolyl-tRNA synthetase-associated protein [Enterococcus sp. 10A9_DIV0425]|uniref:YbaK/prolyl-tRNA synthetase-associated protein n=1 Tax=Candidatus Enterococcus wittei TaxID=1987383 RepID=A0A242K2V7_9ENTE|nr:YbaK/EbsC family protein [Enterococcus sp. 10A9_DIV0425]OTP11376.1 YbaK/prolyl-tRNA synthetase-associated protein [Enterococcus sp. 10A9_DIV0425]THE09482.1 prolyl-tRNA synthetase associated domain-containing protein [Enterococcus hirae]